MNNRRNKKLLGTAILLLSLLGASGCTKDPKGNHKPVVKLPSTKIVKKGELVQIEAFASDIDKDELSYLWRLRTRPQGSQVSFEAIDTTTKKIAFKTDQYGVYTVDFVANDDIVNSDVKTVTIIATHIEGSWKADLTATRKLNTFDPSETEEVIESMSNLYKFVFLKDGSIEGEEGGSWRERDATTYDITYQNGKESSLQIVSEDKLYFFHTLNSGKEVRFVYKRVLK